MSVLCVFLVTALAALPVGCGLNLPPFVDTAEDVGRLSENETWVSARSLPEDELASLERLRQLQHIDFTGGSDVCAAELTDQGVSILADLDLPELDSLLIGFNDAITDDSLQTISGMGRLDFVGFVECPGITDAGLAYLAENAEIRCLHLRQCEGITEEGVRRVLEVQGLESLDFSGTHSVSDSFAIELQKANPQIHIDKGTITWPYQ